MDIPAMSMGLAQTKLNYNVGIAMTKKVMDNQEVMAAGLLQMMEQADVQPSSDHILDIRA